VNEGNPLWARAVYRPRPSCILLENATPAVYSHGSISFLVLSAHSSSRPGDSRPPNLSYSALPATAHPALVFPLPGIFRFFVNYSRDEIRQSSCGRVEATGPNNKKRGHGFADVLANSGKRRVIYGSGRFPSRRHQEPRRRRPPVGLRRLEEEHGDPARAEFIRLQLAHPGSNCRRARELIALHRDRWAPSLGSGGAGVGSCAAFPEEVTSSAMRSSATGAIGSPTILWAC